MTIALVLLVIDILGLLLIAGLLQSCLNDARRERDHWKAVAQGADWPEDNQL